MNYASQTISTHQGSSLEAKKEDRLSYYRTEVYGVVNGTITITGTNEKRSVG